MLHKSDNLCEIKKMFDDTILEVALLQCTQFHK